MTKELSAITGGRPALQSETDILLKLLNHFETIQTPKFITSSRNYELQGIHPKYKEIAAYNLYQNDGRLWFIEYVTQQISLNEHILHILVNGDFSISELMLLKSDLSEK